MREKGWYYIHIEFGRRTTVADDLKCVNISKSDERSGWTNYRALTNKIMDELPFAWLGQITCVGSNKLTSANGRIRSMMGKSNEITCGTIRHVYFKRIIYSFPDKLYMALLMINCTGLIQKLDFEVDCTEFILSFLLYS